MTLQDYVIKRFCDFIERSSSLNRTNLPSLEVIVIVVVEITKFVGDRPYCSRDITDLIFHVTLHDHAIKGLCELMEGSSSLYIPTLPSLVARGIVVVDIMILVLVYIVM